MKNNKPCPKCREKGGDSTGDHLYRAMNGPKKLNFYICRKCGHREYLDGTPLDAEVEEPMVTARDLSYYQKLPHVKDRGIPKEVRELYGVTTECSVTSGEPAKHFYPVTVDRKLKTYKYRDIEKKKAGEKKGAFGRVHKGVTNDTDPFGMLSIRGTPRVLVITEGEEDAMAAYTMLKDKVYNLRAISITDGSGSVNSIANVLKWISKIDKVYFSPDQDAAGEKVVEKIAELIPEVLIITDLGEKDANDMLLKGKTKEYVNSFMRASKYVPKFLVEVNDDLIKEACVKPTWGRKWPWPTLDAKTFGMRDGEGIFVGAGVKIGKSEFLNELIDSRIAAGDGDIPAVAKFEEKPVMTVKKLAGKIDKTFYYRPDLPFKMADLEKSSASLKKKLYLYKAFGQADWDTVKLWIRYCVAFGSKTVIIDPITKLTNHLNPSDTETELRRISDELACLAHDLGFFYIVTCHLKAPPSGKTPHERGGVVQSNQFRGSRAMMENCYYMLGIERNKDPMLTEDERNTSTFVLLDDRMFGQSGRFKVFYNSKTGEYKEPVVSLKHHR